MADDGTALSRLLRMYLTQVAELVDTNFFRPHGQRAPVKGTSTPYATVQLFGDEFLSYNLRRIEGSSDEAAALGFTETDLVEIIDGLDEVTASVQFWKDGRVDGAGRAAWGESAMSRAMSLVKRLELSESVELANTYGLAYQGASRVRDLSATVDGNIERRAQVDLTFTFSSSEAAAQAMFRVVAFSMKIQQPDGHISEVRS